MDQNNQAGISSSAYAPKVGVSQESPISPTTPITANAIKPATPFSIPAVPQSDTASAIAGIAGSVTDSAKALQAQNDAATKAAQDAQNQSNNDLTSTFNQILNVQSSRAQAEQNAGLAQKQEALAKATNALEASQRAQTNELRALDGQGLTDVQRGASAKEINRRYAFEQADLALIQSAANRDFSTAQSIVDRKIELALEPLKTKLDFQKMFYEENKSNFDKADQRRYQALVTQSQREYEQQKVLTEALEKSKLETLKYAQENGATPDVLSAIQSAKTSEDVIRAAGVYGVDAKRQYEIAKLKAEATANQPVTGEWASVINGASGLVANTKKQTVKMNIANAISQENYQNAFTEVANAVGDGLTGSSKTTFEDARTDINVMKGLRDSIQQYANTPGANLSFLKGTADQIAKNFGVLASDPRFAALGVQLQREFQAYRNQMTGAAFSPQESKEYAAVNPRTNASLDLNLATINGALDQLQNRVISTVTARVPDAKKIYDKIINQPAGTYNGVNLPTATTSSAYKGVTLPN